MCPSNSCKCSGPDGAPYIPTWFATPPDSKYMYLCDGCVVANLSSAGAFGSRCDGGARVLRIAAFEYLPALPLILLVDGIGTTCQQAVSVV
jgi:hypothetical protein